MADTTTIEIRDTQKTALDGLKLSDGEPYKDVLQRLIESYEETPEMTPDRVRDIVREEVRTEAVR